MTLFVCIKQVPDAGEIALDPATNTLVRDRAPSIVNPFDSYALEAAARIKDRIPGTKIVALSMGPLQAMQALRECLAMAADKAYLISDSAFGGSDTLATSYILSQAIRQIQRWEGPCDAIFCGKQATDGDTAQVGPELAERLDLPQVTGCLEAEITGQSLTVKRQVEAGVEVLRVPMPCLTAFTKPLWEPRFPTVRRRLAASKAKIPVLTAAQLPELHFNDVGLKGSATRVKNTFVPPHQGGMVIQAPSGEAAAQKLFDVLREAGVLEGEAVKPW